MAPRRLAVVVLNFRTPELTRDCLASLAAEQARFPAFRTILVDNASGDQSVPFLQRTIAENGWASWVDFRPLETNLGFAGGNNLILREIIALDHPEDYILLLNSDTIVGQGCLEYCVRVMEQQPPVAAMSCMLLNKDGTVQNVCRKFPRPDRETARALGLPWLIPIAFRWADLEDSGWDRRAGPRDVDWIGGAFLLARTSALKATGVFDEAFFFYGEDCELCFRIRKHGYRILFDPGAQTVHLGGASSDSRSMRSRRKDILTWRARFLVQHKCYGPAAAAWIRSVYTATFAIRLGLLALRGGARSEKFASLREGLSQLMGPLEI